MWLAWLTITLGPLSQSKQKKIKSSLFIHIFQKKKDFNCSGKGGHHNDTTHLKHGSHLTEKSFKHQSPGIILKSSMTVSKFNMCYSLDAFFNNTFISSKAEQ